MRRLAIVVLLLCGCSSKSGSNCTLDTVEADCAAACWRSDGGLPATGSPDWPCQPDPLCVDGRWQFFCK
jgi:hypothetical protein